MNRSDVERLNWVFLRVLGIPPSLGVILKCNECLLPIFLTDKSAHGEIYLGYVFGEFNYSFLQIFSTWKYHKRCTINAYADLYCEIQIFRMFIYFSQFCSTTMIGKTIVLLIRVNHGRIQSLAFHANWINSEQHDYFCTFTKVIYRIV